MVMKSSILPDYLWALKMTFFDLAQAVYMLVILKTIGLLAY